MFDISSISKCFYLKPMRMNMNTAPNLSLTLLLGRQLTIVSILSIFHHFQQFSRIFCLFLYIFWHFFISHLLPTFLIVEFLYYSKFPNFLLVPKNSQHFWNSPAFCSFSLHFPLFSVFWTKYPEIYCFRWLSMMKTRADRMCCGT